jgi:hypothetical protein
VSVSAQLNADQIARAEGIGSGLIGEKLNVKKIQSVDIQATKGEVLIHCRPVMSNRDRSPVIPNGRAVSLHWTGGAVSRPIIHNSTVITHVEIAELSRTHGESPSEGEVRRCLAKRVSKRDQDFVNPLTRAEDWSEPLGDGSQGKE